VVVRVGRALTRHLQNLPNPHHQVLRRRERKLLEAKAYQRRQVLQAANHHLANIDYFQTFNAYNILLSKELRSFSNLFHSNRKMLLQANKM